MASREDYREGAERLLGFLASEYDDDGASASAPDNIQFYYKMPAVFSYGGRRRLALRTLEQFERQFLRDDHLELDPIADPWAAYLAGWVAWGAGMLGRFDLAQQVMRAVADRQDATSGGFFHASEHGRVYDTERTSAAAMGCVWAMELERATRAAAFLERALSDQPDPGTFHTYRDEAGEFVRDESDRNAYFSIRDPHARPALFATTVACLVWLGRATQTAAHFDLAERYMQLVLSHEDDPAQMPLATKTGWSALMVAAHRPNDALRDFARRSGDNILGRQEEDGGINFDDVPDVPKPIDKVWLIGWGCDAALTLMSLADAAD